MKSGLVKAFRAYPRLSDGLMARVTSMNWLTSSVFWSAAGVIATVCAAYVGRTASPKQQLSCKMRWREGSLSQYHGKPVVSPYTVALTIKAKGRRDIAPDAFGGSPWPIDVGAPIVGCLNLRTDPNDQPVPCVTTDGPKLLIHPVKIGKSETIKVRLLVDGVPKPRKPVQSLTNVRIVSRVIMEDDLREVRKELIVAAIVIIIGIALTGLLAIKHAPMPTGLPYY